MITRREYLKAKKVVDAYTKQLDKPNVIASSYHFLYWLNDEQVYPDSERYKTIRAKSIEIAIRKFLRAAPKSLTRIDEEVGHKDGFIDISQFKQIKNWL
jgi:hypothetical protein